MKVPTVLQSTEALCRKFVFFKDVLADVKIAATT